MSIYGEVSFFSNCNSLKGLDNFIDHSSTLEDQVLPGEKKLLKLFEMNVFQESDVSTKVNSAKDFKKLQEALETLKELKRDLENLSLDLDTMRNRYFCLFKNISNDKSLLNDILKWNDWKNVLERSLDKVVSLSERDIGLLTALNSKVFNQHYFLRDMQKVAQSLDLSPKLKNQIEGVCLIYKQEMLIFNAQNRRHKNRFLSPTSNVTSIDTLLSPIREEKLEQVRVELDRKADLASGGRIHFKAEHLQKEHIIDGNCHSISLEFAQKILERKETGSSMVIERVEAVAKSALKEASKFFIHGKKRGTSKEIEERQIVFNALSIETSGLSEEVIRTLKIQATAACFDLNVTRSFATLEIPESQKPTIEEKNLLLTKERREKSAPLIDAFNKLNSPGVYLVRGVKIEASGDAERKAKEQAAIMRKKEVYGHSMVLVRTVEAGDYFFDPNTGLLEPNDGESIGSVAAAFVMESRDYWGLSSFDVFSLAS